MWRVRIDQDYHAHIYFICDGIFFNTIMNVSNNDKQIDETKAEFLFYEPSENDVKNIPML